MQLFCEDTEIQYLNQILTVKLTRRKQRNQPRICTVHGPKI